MFGHRLELAVALVVEAGARARRLVAEVALVALQLVEHALDAALLLGAGPGSSPRWSSWAASPSSSFWALDHLQERVLDQLLLDALLEVQRRQLQDLHGLDHLRRLDQSLLHAGRLVQS